ncbi:hypothetical protein QF038_001838 [Pseudarthrobacter sp. W1I19]|uniref:phage protease n=1 Tax=Pseudarthrobacter sp. W1I19 TaxID=3042288 RepID=UPI002784E7DA|nr:phage protease [Pseudarthrobacter sp. W1I19]MDQ0923330.1 hypothetical protein [Pseudarthrobacter sp. W1I19]
MSQHAHLYRAIAIKADSSGNLPTEIQLLTPGNWKTPWHGDFEITQADISQFAANFAAGISRVNKTSPLPINYDHSSGAAAGWIHGLEDRGADGLWGTGIEWTPSGAQKVRDHEYAFFSPEFNTRDLMYEDPEEAGTRVPNVLSAAALTNSPLFKKLKPVMASEGGSKGEDRMKLEDVRKKALADLDDAEKKFLAEHKDELTVEERKSFDVQTDADKAAEQEAADKAAADKEAEEKAAAEKVEASAKTVTINASDLAKLKADAARGVEAAEKLARTEASSFVSEHIARGAIKSGQKDEAVEILLASSPKQRENLEKFLKGLPENKLITAGEMGGGGDGGTDSQTAADELDKLTSDYAAEKKISYAQALQHVASAKPELYAAANKVTGKGDQE